MWLENGAGILRMVLHAYVPAVVDRLHSLYKSVLRVEANAAHACCVEVVAEVVVELIAVAVALHDVVYAISLVYLAVWQQMAWIAAQTHGAAHVCDVLLFLHDVDDIVWRVLIHLAAVGIGQFENIARILDDHDLHAEADAECRHVVLAAVLRCDDLALYASCAKAWADDDAVACVDSLRHIVLGELFAVDECEGCAAVVVGGSVRERLVYGDVCVLKVVFAHKPYVQRALCVVALVKEIVP